MTTQTEAMRLALEALESCGAAHITDGGLQWYDEKLVDTAYAALREALAKQPAQEPVFSFQMQLRPGWGGQYPRAVAIGEPDIESLFGKVGDVVTFYASPQPAARKAHYTSADNYGTAPVQGWKLVPVDPTIQMCLAGAKAADSNDGAAEKAYYAMLAAAPQPTQQQEARIAQLEAELMRMQGRELKLQFAMAEQPAQQPDAIVTSLTADPDGVARSGLDRELPLMAGVYLAPQPAQQQEPVSFLANGTRFKMSFFDCAAPEGDEHGESDVGTYVTCFEAFAKELDGRWVALVAADDDCHLKLTSPQPAQQQQEPVAWMEMVVANLVREGVNKHKARELAQHFYTSPQPAQQQEPVGYVYSESGVKNAAIQRDVPNGTPLYTSIPAQQEPVAWMHEWEDGERIPTLHPRDARESDKPTSVRPLVYGDTSPSAHRKPLTDDPKNTERPQSRAHLFPAEQVEAVKAQLQEAVEAHGLTAKPEPPSQCSKCEVSDPAITDLCREDACGMREGT